MANDKSGIRLELQNGDTFSTTQLESCLAGLEQINFGSEKEGSKTDSELAQQFVSRFGVQSPNDVLVRLNSPAQKKLLAAIDDDLAALAVIREWNQESIEAEQSKVYLMMALAADVHEMNEKKKLHYEIQQQITKFQRQGEQLSAQQRLQQQQEVKRLTSQLKELDKSITALDTKIEELETEIHEVKAKLHTLQVESKNSEQYFNESNALLDTLVQQLSSEEMGLAMQEQPPEFSPEPEDGFAHHEGKDETVLVEPVVTTKDSVIVEELRPLPRPMPARTKTRSDKIDSIIVELRSRTGHKGSLQEKDVELLAGMVNEFIVQFSEIREKAYRPTKVFEGIDTMRSGYHSHYVGLQRKFTSDELSLSDSLAKGFTQIQAVKACRTGLVNSRTFMEQALRELTSGSYDSGVEHKQSFGHF